MEQFDLGANEGRADYHYDDWSGLEKMGQFSRDLQSIFSRGEHGSDYVVAFTGSVDVDWRVVGYNNNGNVELEVHVQNATTQHSALRIPFLTSSRGDGRAGSGADASAGEIFMIQSMRFRIEV